MRGVCDTCDEVSELFQLAGRRDVNCARCHDCIRNVLQLYKTLLDVERAGCYAGELEAHLMKVLARLLSRFQFDAMEVGTYLQ
jgi:hypothetical protein